MQSVDLYSLSLIFYLLIGIAHGVGLKGLVAYNRDRSIKAAGLYLICGSASLVYGVIGLGTFQGGNPLYVYVPPIALWFAGQAFGRSLFPIHDRSMAGFVIGCLSVGIFLYHRFL